LGHFAGPWSRLPPTRGDGRCCEHRLHVVSGHRPGFSQITKTRATLQRSLDPAKSADKSPRR
jgi:hypothetical protein